jgi:hypothetical protein
MELNGKWGAYNLDGGFHQCKSGTKNGISSNSNSKPLSLEDLDTRLRKVEAWLRVFSQGQAEGK